MTNNSRARDRGGRHFALVLACLVVGAIAALIAAAREWDVSGGGERAGLLYAARDAAALVRALALVGLASVVASYAVRGWARVVVGILVALSGAAIVVTCSVHLQEGPWPIIATAGGLVITVAGVQLALHGRSWPSMSNRYEREARAAAKPSNAWDVIDRGGDPTA